MKRLLLLPTVVLSLLAVQAQSLLPTDSVLRRMAAQMLMVGFKGDSVDENSDAARYVRDLGVGAIILFDVDLTGDATIGSRNVTSKERLACLTRQLQAWAPHRLLIALDQEGGRVAHGLGRVFGQGGPPRHHSPLCPPFGARNAAKRG